MNAFLLSLIISSCNGIGKQSRTLLAFIRSAESSVFGRSKFQQHTYHHHRSIPRREQTRTLQSLAISCLKDSSFNNDSEPYYVSYIPADQTTADLSIGRSIGHRASAAVRPPLFKVKAPPPSCLHEWRWSCRKTEPTIIGFHSLVDWFFHNSIGGNKKRFSSIHNITIVAYQVSAAYIIRILITAYHQHMTRKDESKTLIINIQFKDSSFSSINREPHPIDVVTFSDLYYTYILEIAYYIISFHHILVDAHIQINDTNNGRTSWVDRTIARSVAKWIYVCRYIIFDMKMYHFPTYHTSKGLAR
jgi:hypothetical protein